MRTELLDFVRQLNLGKYRIDTALPRTESGDSLVVKNPGRLYVDTVQISDTPLVLTLNGHSIYVRTSAVTVAFATDSKNLSANYNELVDQLLTAKDAFPQMGFNSSDATITTDYENDLLITEIEFSYTKLK